MLSKYFLLSHASHGHNTSQDINLEKEQKINLFIFSITLRDESVSMQLKPESIIVEENK